MKSHAFQSLPELLLYVILIGVLIINIIGLTLSIKVQQEQNRILSNHSVTINTIEDNQKANALAIKTYIACLITPGVLAPTDTTSQLKVAEQQCFDNAPQVK